MRPPYIIIAVALFAVALYVFALAIGTATVIGYASGDERHQGPSSTTWLPIDLGFPVWLRAGSAIAADYDVNAAFGSLALTVAPPLILRTSLQAATAYVAGRRAGQVIFVVDADGWYRFTTEPSVIYGRHCERRRSMAEIMIGSSDCLGYEVSYRVVWRLASPDVPRQDATRLRVPRRHEALVTAHIGG